VRVFIELASDLGSVSDDKNSDYRR
jgi:hypothetical protein